MLSSYRVLDLSDGRGIFCSKILSDLGADVVQIEPPSGSPARLIGPFYENDPDREKSLFWACFANNKRGITLNLESHYGRDIFRKLVASSHFLIESFRPGYLEHLGLSYRYMSDINPSLIYVSITPFGQNGPYNQYQATDLIGMALSGMMYLTGDPDRPPVRISTPQFWVTGSASAASGAMIASHYRILTGRGQHVDVSCQQAVARSLSHAPVIWDLNKINMQRQGPFRPIGKVNLRINWECLDGYVNFIQPGGHTGGRSMLNLANWMDEEGYGHPVLKETNWGDIGFGQLSKNLVDTMTPPLEDFFKTKTKSELGQESLRRRILLFPVNDPKDIFAYPQLLSRNFFQDIGLPGKSKDDRTMKMLGPFITYRQNAKGLLRKAPYLGEHNQEIYHSEMGISIKEILAMKVDKII